MAEAFSPLSKAEKTISGLYTGGKIPLGYRVKEGKFEVVAEEEDIICEIFYQYVGGLSLVTIGKMVLEIHKHGRKRGETIAPYNAEQLSKIISNPMYKGYPAYGRIKKVGSKQVLAPQNEWIVAPGPIQNLIIIKEEIWEKANKKLQEEKATV